MNIKKADKKILILINVVCVVVLLAVVIPLLMLAPYNYPSADDWVYGKNVHDALKNNEGILGFFHGVAKTLRENQWEARFSNSLFASVHPGVFGEEYYSLVPYIILGALVFSQFFLIKKCLTINDKENNWLVMPIITPILAMQILYCPAPEESFYWYCGAINYSFMYCMSLVLGVLIIKLGFDKLSKVRRVMYSVLACITAFLLGGNNYATSLSTVCFLLAADVISYIYNREIFKRTWFITLPVMVSFLMCVFSPYTQVRINTNFGGEVLYSPIEAVWMSLYKAATIIWNWRDPKVLMVLIFILPFVWKAVQKIEFDFKFPVLFTIISFGIFASQLTATMYVDGTVGGGRQLVIIWYSYLVLLVANMLYWCGWLSKKDFLKTIDLSGKRLLVYCILAGVLIIGTVAPSANRTTAFKAYKSLKKGWAQQYGEIWEERLKVLKDESIKQVEFTPIPYMELMCSYSDFDVESSVIYWVNTACASYYDKEYIHLITEESE